MKSDLLRRKRQRGAAAAWVFAGFAVVALFFLLTEHRAHLYGWLPYLLFAVCPLIHLFHGHGGHAGLGNDQEPRRADKLEPPAGPSNKDVSPAAHQHH
jgi:hypothetical protein